MSIPLAERELSPEVLHAHNKKYGFFVKEALGLSRNGSDWLTVDSIVRSEGSAQRLAEASEGALLAISPNVASMIRMKFGLESPGDEAISDRELGFILGKSSSTINRMMRRAIGSLRYGDRMEGIKRVVYPERYQG